MCVRGAGSHQRRAMSSSFSVLLLLAVCLFTCIIAESSSKCPNITLSQRSSSAPVVRNGTNYTIYQEFVSDGNIQDLNISWTREPFGLDPTTQTFRIENTIVDSRTLKASIVLWNIQVVPDKGEYTVTASDECGVSNRSVFSLDVVDSMSCNQYEKPQPIILQNSTAVAEPDLGPILQLTVKFHGPSDGDFLPLWMFEDMEICLEESDNVRFNCDRTVLGVCSFQANLWVLSPSYASSGQYSVFAIDTSGDDRGNSSIINLSIVKLPKVQSCTSGSVKTNSKGYAEFQCILSNYSDYVQVVVVEDNRVEYNESTRDVSFGCEAHTQDRSQATCTVRVSTSSATSSDSKRDYQLCAGYNDSVTHTTQLQCSETIAVTFSGTSSKSQGLVIGLIVGASVAFLLLLLLIPIVYVVAHRRRSTAVGSSTPLTVNDATRPLLHPSDDLTLQGDRTMAGLSVKVPSPRKPTAPGVDSNVERDYYQSSGTAADTNANGSGSLTASTSPNGPDSESGALWRTVRPGPLEREELVHIAKAIPRWSTLARYLGLSEPVIVTISEDYRGDYEEQKFQMLLAWYQQQLNPPSRQSLVRIIEEGMGSVLAQDIVNIVGTEPVH